MEDHSDSLGSISKGSLGNYYDKLARNYDIVSLIVGGELSFGYFRCERDSVFDNFVNEVSRVGEYRYLQSLTDFFYEFDPSREDAIEDYQKKMGAVSIELGILSRQPEFFINEVSEKSKKFLVDYPEGQSRIYRGLGKNLIEVAE